MTDTASYKRNSSISSLSSSSEQDEDDLSTSTDESVNRHQLEDAILYKITNQLDPAYLPGILTIIQHVADEEDEVEIDLRKLDREQLESILFYVNACIQQEAPQRRKKLHLTPPIEKQQKRRKEKQKPKKLHRRRLLEDMLHPLNGLDTDSSSDGECNIIIFKSDQSDSAFIENQTIVHEQSQQGSNSDKFDSVIEEDSGGEMIDIML
ncbi:hypothetical protein G6F60_002865 [Rhizopus arrhizus]|nr:hypothetical protein G6F60_002865 [Rhizopus arrhizus]